MNKEEYQKLEDFEKVILIAELCGWKRDKSRTNSSGGYPWNHPDQTFPPLSCYTAWTKYDLYEYLEDLNACHDMEKLIPSDRTGRWMAHLCDASKDAREHTAKACAKSRCQAFVLTMTETIETDLELDPKLESE